MTRAARSGNSVCEPLAEQLFQLQRQAQQHVAGFRSRRRRAPRSGCASISLSLMAGTMGAVMTATGTPASLSALMASSRRGGVAARGSILRATRRSSVVTEIATLTRPAARHAGEDIDVARHQGRLGDDADGMARCGPAPPGSRG